MTRKKKELNDLAKQRLAREKENERQRRKLHRRMILDSQFVSEAKKEEYR